MSRIPEPGLQPPEYPPIPLRCCRCLRPVQRALELPRGNLCRRCLQESSMDELSALLCAGIIEEEYTPSSGGTL